MKTNIRITLLLLSLVCTTSLVAQNPLHFGIKGGVNLSDYTNDIENNSMKVGYNAGITVDYRINKTFYLVSGLEVASKGTKIKQHFFSDIPENSGYQNSGQLKSTYNPIYLQVPIHVGYRLHAAEDMAVLFHLGPFVSYGVGGKITREMAILGEKSKEKIDAFGTNGPLKRWDVGLGVGIGFAFQRYGVNFGYDLGFVDAYKGDESIKNNTAHVSLSYRFL